MSVRLNSLRPAPRGAAGVVSAATLPAGCQFPAVLSAAGPVLPGSAAIPATGGYLSVPPVVFPAGATSVQAQHTAPAGKYVNTSRRSLLALGRVVTRSTATETRATRLRSGRVLT